MVHQRAYKQYVLECLAGYSVKKMPYLILPKYYPSGEEKVFKLRLSLIPNRHTHTYIHTSAFVLRW